MKFLVSFAGISAWWYFYEYNYYLAFADGQTLSSEANIKNEINPTQIYTWCDDTYQYTVSVPDFLDTGGFAGMSRLDNNEARTVELAITRWENEKYIFHVFVNDAETVRYFIVDSDLNLYGNYTEEEMANRKMELDECKDEVQILLTNPLRPSAFCRRAHFASPKVFLKKFSFSVGIFTASPWRVAERG